MSTKRTEIVLAVLTVINLNFSCQPCKGVGETKVILPSHKQ